jgi:hypothetical protein
MIAKLSARQRPNVNPGAPGRRLVVPLWLAALAGLGGCGGGGGGGSSSGTPGGHVQLMSVQYGRLVDVYAYRKLDPTRGDRRDRLHRQGVLVAKNVVINPSIET